MVLDKELLINFLHDINIPDNMIDLYYDKFINDITRVLLHTLAFLDEGNESLTEFLKEEEKNAFFTKEQYLLLLKRINVFGEYKNIIDISYKENKVEKLYGLNKYRKHYKNVIPIDNEVSTNIKEYIKSNMLQNLNPLEISYTIYVLLNRILEYSPDYASFKEDLTKDISTITLDNPFVNCHSWSKIYASLLNEYGIEACVSMNSEKSHSYVTFRIDTFMLKADATLSLLGYGYLDRASDLTNYKLNLDNNGFTCVNDENKKTYEKKLNEVISKINKLLDVKENSKEIEDYLKELNNYDLSEKERVVKGIEFLNSIYQSICRCTVEKRQFLDVYYEKIFQDKDNKKYKIISTYSKENDHLVSHRLIIFTLENGNTLFGYEATNSFKILSDNELKNLIENNIINIKYEGDYNKLNSHLKNGKILTKN